MSVPSADDDALLRESSLKYTLQCLRGGRQAGPRTGVSRGGDADVLQMFGGARAAVFRQRNAADFQQRFIAHLKKPLPFFGKEMLPKNGSATLGHGRLYVVNVIYPPKNGSISLPKNGGTFAAAFQQTFFEHLYNRAAQTTVPRASACTLRG